MVELTRPTVHQTKTQSVNRPLITLMQSQHNVMARDPAHTMVLTELPVIHAEEATNSLIFTTLANKSGKSNFLITKCAKFLFRRTSERKQSSPSDSLSLYSF